jgi:hypothetical protein
VCIAIFVAEAAMKIVAYGLFGNQGTYFRDKWNILDFVVAVEGLVTLAFSASGSLSGFRLVRVLRPLRTLSRLRGLKLVISALARSLSILFSIFVISVFFMAVLGIIGVQVSAAGSCGSCALAWRVMG